MINTSDIKRGDMFRVTASPSDASYSPPTGTIVCALSDGDNLMGLPGYYGESHWLGKGKSVYISLHHLEPIPGYYGPRLSRRAEPKPPPRGTQQDKVLSHLRRKTITDVEASGLYGIGQCAGCVFKLRKRGYNIVSTMRQGVRARYAEYSLAA